MASSPIENNFDLLYFKFISTTPPSCKFVLLPNNRLELSSNIALTKLELLSPPVKSTSDEYALLDVDVNLVE